MSDDNPAIEPLTADGPAPGEPTQAEIDAWAARGRARREAWLKGPTRGGARRVREAPPHRRLADTFDEGEQMVDEGAGAGSASGARASSPPRARSSLFYKFSRRTFAELVKAGREWEEDTALPSRRRRVPLDDEVD